MKALLDQGVLDPTQKTFRAADSAVRAEFAKVLVKLQKIAAPRVPATPSFEDTDVDAWYNPFIEESATRGWMKGYNNCYGTHPCSVMPGAATTRAEAIAMIVRYYDFKPKNVAPMFADVSKDAWYRDVLQAAADRCIVLGDDLTGLVAPSRLVNRAEMVSLFARAQQHLIYGKDCGVKAASGSNLSGSIVSRNGGVYQNGLGIGMFALLSSTITVNVLRNRRNRSSIASFSRNR